jgi:hypothetical protein
MANQITREQALLLIDIYATEADNAVLWFNHTVQGNTFNVDYITFWIEEWNDFVRHTRYAKTTTKQNSKVHGRGLKSKTKRRTKTKC